MLADVEGVEVVAQGHEHPAVIGVFLGDRKAQHIAVEALGGLVVGDPQIDVADGLQLDHGGLPNLVRATAPRVSRKGPLRKLAGDGNGWYREIGEAFCDLPAMLAR